jgi:hypothetical protein
MYKIEKNVPIPPKADCPFSRNRPRYGFKYMREVGDSIFVPVEGEKTVAELQRSLSAMVAGAKRRLGYEFTTRQTLEKGIAGVRIWRTK